MTYAQHALKVLNGNCPGLDPELAQLYALLALTRGTRTTLQDVHDAWAVWRCGTRPDHPSLVPFDQLTPEVQELDREYMNAIHRTARQVSR
jgi:hypothetical protein